jgi:aromatic ring hydroxylase
MTLAASSTLRSAEEYRESLRDGRRVFYRGKRVEDVTTHPVLKTAVDHAALDYILAEDPEHRDLAVSEEGYSRYFALPRSAEDLLRRTELIDLATREGRTLVVLIKEIGSDALFALSVLGERLGSDEAARVERFFDHVRANDLAVAVAQTDSKGDRSLPPAAQPDAYVRVVDRNDEGIVVRGAKMHTSVSVNANELIVLPTRAMSEDDAAHAVAFAIPVDTEGLRLIASPFLDPTGRSAEEHPLSAGRKMAETTTLFDDVLVPWDRVFLDGKTELSGELARGFVEFHRFTAVSYKLPLLDALVGSALLITELNGLRRAGHVRDKLSWLITYVETIKALLRSSAMSCTVENGIAVPDTMLVNIAKLHFAQGLHQAFGYVQDIAGGLLATYPSHEDLDSEEYGVQLRGYLAGAGGADGRDRLRVLNLISDLTTGDFGGYQAVLAIHAEGSIEAEKLTILAQFEAETAVGYARRLAGLE